MVVLAVLLYCLVPSGCPIGHIVYLWTLTVAVSRFFCGAAGQIRTADLILTNRFLMIFIIISVCF